LELLSSSPTSRIEGVFEDGVFEAHWSVDLEGAEVNDVDPSAFLKATCNSSSVLEMPPSW